MGGVCRRGLLAVAPLVAFLPTVGASTAQAVPFNLAPPAISGTAVPGQVLTASPGTWTEEPTEYRYSWEGCNSSGDVCAAFGGEGARRQTFAVRPGDALHSLRVRVTAVNAAGESEPAVSAAVKVDTAWHWVRGSPKVKPLPWWLRRSARSSRRGKWLTVGISAGYCVGEPRPVIDRVRVVERRKTAKRRFRSAVVTVFVRFPAPTEVVGKVNPGEPIPACAGVGYRLSRTVKLKRPVSRLFVFDGSRTPPRRVLRPARKIVKRSSAHRRTASSGRDESG